MPVRRHRSRAVLAALLASLLAGPGPARANWVASWAAAPALLASPSLRATTVRQSLRLSLGGPQLRVRFSNETGTRAMTVGGAHIALPGAAPGSVDPATDRALTFGGASTAAIPPGAPLLSDPVDLPVAALSTVVITALVDGAEAKQVGHDQGGETAFLLPGDHLGDATFKGATTATSRYALSGVEVNVPGQTAAAVGALGDSTTDGVGSTPDRDRRWTDRLAERLVARTGAAIPAVVNLGLAGNTVTGGTPFDTFGEGALARLDRDGLSRPGLRWLVLLEGLNDVMFTASPGTVAADLIAADRQIIARAHERGILVVGGTLTPFGGTGQVAATPASEAARQAVNAWIRTGGAFDATVDFDAALRDPARTTQLRATFDSGDHLHPSDAGYRAMGDAVPLDLFK